MSVQVKLHSSVHFVRVYPEAGPAVSDGTAKKHKRCVNVLVRVVAWKENAGETIAPIVI